MIDMLKITAQCIFKLTIPIRMKGDLSAEPVKLDIGKHSVYIYPPARYDSSKPEFVWSAKGKELGKDVDGIPVWNADTVLINVEGIIKSRDIQEDEESEIKDAAVKGLERLLRTYRWRSRQGEVYRGGIVFQLVDSYQARYFDSSGNMLSRLRMVVSLSPIAATLKASEVWREVSKDMTLGKVPEFWESLILDAHQEVSADPGLAIIKAHAACESFIEMFCDERFKKVKNKRRLDDIVYNRLTPKNLQFTEYFDVVLRYLSGHSLKIEKEELYAELDRLYRTASNVRHEGRCYYKESKKLDDGKFTSEEVIVDWKRAQQMISAAENAIEWAQSLGAINNNRLSGSTNQNR